MVFSDMRTRELSKYLKIKPKVCQADSFKDPLPWFWRCVLIKAEIMILNMQLRKTKAPHNISVCHRFSSTWSLSDWESFGGLSSWYCKHWYLTVDSSLLIFCYLMLFSAPSLTTLQLHYCFVNSEKVAFHHFPKSIKKLSLEGCEFFNLPADKSIFKHVDTHMPQLEELDLTRWQHWSVCCSRRSWSPLSSSTDAVGWRTTAWWRSANLKGCAFSDSADAIGRHPGHRHIFSTIKTLTLICSGSENVLPTRPLQQDSGLTMLRFLTCGTPTSGTQRCSALAGRRPSLNCLSGGSGGRRSLTGRTS